ncbi:MAG: hypothetical protein Q8R35_00385 [bacterium]|nr:hypothetical protein [bacterium]
MDTPDEELIMEELIFAPAQPSEWDPRWDNLKPIGGENTDQVR